MIKLVIFDLDGTVFDAYKAVCKSLNYALAKFGYSELTLEQVKRSVGHGERNLLLKFVSEDKVDEVQSLYREYGADHFTELVTLLPAAKETLEWLHKQGYKVAVATNRPGWSARMVLDILKIADWFDYIVCGDEVLNVKPDPEIVFKILDHFKLFKEEAIFVGDMDLDIQTGKSAGVKTFAVPTGSCYKEELVSAGPDHLANSLAELPEYILTLPLVGRGRGGAK
ncbi:MAG: HAD family hydrolase [Candidatus Omnitrophica bacterium]|nr:HAD family hydrolase [Candidatus Omnitrophota bacterium]